MASRWGVGWDSVGSSRGSAGEFLRLWSRCRNGTSTELEGTFVGRGVPSWLLLVWGVFGKSVGAWWGLSGASKGLRAASFCV